RLTMLRRFVAETYGPRAWGKVGYALLYALLSAPLGLLGLAYLLVAGLVGAALAVTLVGVPVLALIPLSAPAPGVTHRSLTRHRRAGRACGRWPGTSRASGCHSHASIGATGRREMCPAGMLTINEYSSRAPTATIAYVANGSRAGARSPPSVLNRAIP